MLTVKRSGNAHNLPLDPVRIERTLLVHDRFTELRLGLHAGYDDGHVGIHSGSGKVVFREGSGIRRDDADALVLPQHPVDER